MADWDDLLRDLNQYHCACGSGGPMACEDDCPGDIRDGSTVRTLVALIEAVQALEKREAVHG